MVPLEASSIPSSAGLSRWVFSWFSPKYMKLVYKIRFNSIQFMILHLPKQLTQWMETTDNTATVKLRRRQVRNLYVLIEPPVIHIACDAIQTQIKQGLDFFASRHFESTLSNVRLSKNLNILETLCTLLALLFSLPGLSGRHRAKCDWGKP